MNWLGFLTLFVGLAAYYLGLRIARLEMPQRVRFLAVFAFALLAIPALVYDLYYAKVLGEPIWLYRLRTLPGSELLAAFSGLLAGWTQVRLVPHSRISAVGKRFLVPIAFAFALSLPYLKPVLRPLRTETFREEWRGDVCLQSTPSTCGPAAAATIVRFLGRSVSEQELAHEVFTSRSGTENWYLARALRRRGFTTDFVLATPATVSLPAIAGVRLRSLGNSGHFIAILRRENDNYVVADPLEGMITNTLPQLNDPYEFTGFFLVIGTNLVRSASP